LRAINPDVRIEAHHERVSAQKFAVLWPVSTIGGFDGSTEWQHRFFRCLMALTFARFICFMGGKQRVVNGSKTH
jgi:hypothetical protein